MSQMDLPSYYAVAQVIPGSNPTERDRIQLISIGMAGGIGAGGYNAVYTSREEAAAKAANISISPNRICVLQVVTTFEREERPIVAKRHDIRS